MSVLKWILILGGISLGFGCHRDRSIETPTPVPFEMTIKTVSQLQDVEGAYTTAPTHPEVANVEEVLEVVRSLDWEKESVRYELTILRKVPDLPDARMEIRHIDEEEHQTEIIYFEDTSQPGETTRLRIGTRDGQALANAAKLFFRGSSKKELEDHGQILDKPGQE